MKKRMKNTLWIFLIIGVIAGIWLFLQKKGKLELATGIEPVLDAKSEKEFIPGTDRPVGLRPRPGNNLLGFLSPFNRRILGL